jgi:outer membrane protein OmpA-like peptidoglycan-associated protein
MNTYFAKRALIVLGLLAVPALAGCQTVAGFGRDVQHAGRWISGGAQTTEGWIFGSEEGQAAEASQTGTGQQAAALEAGDHVVYFATGSAAVPSDAMDEIREIASARAGDFTTNAGQSSDESSMGGTSMQSSSGGTGQGMSAAGQGYANSSMQAGNTAMQNTGMSSGQGMTGNNATQSASSSSGQGSGNGMNRTGRRYTVIGYTDTTGSAATNRRLSERRAEAVADALAAQGVPRDAIDVQWHGEDQLPVPTADGVAEPQNRSVRIIMNGA